MVKPGRHIRESAGQENPTVGDPKRLDRIPADPTWITVCDTCKRPEWRADQGETDGERLAILVEKAASLPDASNVKVRRHSCLMGCANACNVTVQAAGKLCYTLGGFLPEPGVAQAIVTYAALHADSDGGQVAYRQWPQPIKGHFVTRHPPLSEA